MNNGEIGGTLFGRTEFWIRHNIEIDPADYKRQKLTNNSIF